MYNAETLFWVVVFQCGVYFFKACILGSAVAIVLKIVTGFIAGSASTLVNMGGQVACLLYTSFSRCPVSMEKSFPSSSTGSQG